MTKTEANSATKQYAHSEFVDLDLVDACFDRFGARRGRGKAGQIVSRLLTSAARRGEVKVQTSSCRITGRSVRYECSPEVFEAIKAAAVEKATGGAQ